MTNINRHIKFFAIFFLTLINYGDYLSLVSVSLLLVLSLVSSEARIRNTHTIFLSFGILFISFYTSLSLFFPEQYLIQEVDKDLLIFKAISRYILLLNLFLVLILYRQNDMVEVLVKLVKLNIAIFVIQIISYYGFSFDLDISSFIIGEEQRNSFLGYYRPTGLYLEPSNFGIVLLSYLLSLFFLGYNNHKLYMVSVLVLYLTFSTAMFLAASIFTVSYIFRYRLIFKPFIAICISLFLLPVLYIAISFIETRYGGSASAIDEAGSVQIRAALIDFIMIRQWSDIQFYFGEGMFSYNIEMIKQLTLIDAVAAIDDGGLLITLIVRYGLFGLFLLAFIFALILKGKSNRVAYMSSFFCKYNIFTGLFFLPLISCCLDNDNDNDN